MSKDIKRKRTITEEPAILITKKSEQSFGVDFLNWGDREDECIGFLANKAQPQILIQLAKQHFLERQKKKESKPDKSHPTIKK